MLRAESGSYRPMNLPLRAPMLTFSMNAAQVAAAQAAAAQVATELVSWCVYSRDREVRRWGARKFKPPAAQNVVLRVQSSVR